MNARTVTSVVVSVLFFHTNSIAGIFGPSNFEECVLDKMKGQAPNLIQIARAACWKAFPAEPTEVVIQNDRIKYTWCKSDYNEMAVCIDQLPSKVKITKIEGLFFEDDCDAKEQTKSGVTATAEKPWYGSTYKFDTPPAKRGCAYFTFYGIEKK